MRRVVFRRACRSSLRRSEDLIRRTIEIMASPWWMLAFFAFALVAALVAIHRPAWITPAWSVPLALFTVSLLSAILIRPRFRRDWSLLGLHLGLLVLVLAVFVSRMTYFDGAVTLVVGEEFGGRLQVDRRGPLHSDGSPELRFANEGFAETFVVGHRWPTTEARVSWSDQSGRQGEAVIDNDRPLLLEGYRIFPTFNRGYAPIFEWRPAGAGAEIGAVQLRAGSGFSVAMEWQLPKAEPPPLSSGERREALGSATLPHRLVLRTENERTAMQPGDEIALNGGSLKYLRLGAWMGYRVVYDSTLYWMISAAMVAVACMVFYYGRLLRGAGGQ
jgi:hypothetical protein